MAYFWPARSPIALEVPSSAASACEDLPSGTMRTPISVRSVRQDRRGAVPALYASLAPACRGRIALVLTARGFLAVDAHERLLGSGTMERPSECPAGLLHRLGAPRQGIVFWQPAQMNAGR